MDPKKEAFQAIIKQLHNAELQSAEILSKMAESAVTPSARLAFVGHCIRTHGHLQRLVHVAQMCGFKPTGQLCLEIKTATVEMHRVILRKEPSRSTDLMLVNADRNLRSHFISQYTAADMCAHDLGLSNCCSLLKESLKEEEEALQTLERIVELLQEPLGESHLEAKSGPNSRSTKNNAAFRPAKA